MLGLQPFWHSLEDPRRDRLTGAHRFSAIRGEAEPACARRAFTSKATSGDSLMFFAGISSSRIARLTGLPRVIRFISLPSSPGCEKRISQENGAHEGHWEVDREFCSWNFAIGFLKMGL
jgi:hypothetical protein